MQRRNLFLMKVSIRRYHNCVSVCFTGVYENNSGRFFSVRFKATSHYLRDELFYFFCCCWMVWRLIMLHEVYSRETLCAQSVFCTGNCFCYDNKFYSAWCIIKMRHESLVWQFRFCPPISRNPLNPLYFVRISANTETCQYDTLSDGPVTLSYLECKFPNNAIAGQSCNEFLRLFIILFNCYCHDYLSGRWLLHVVNAESEIASIFG